MTDKRFMIDDAGELIDLNNHQFIDYGDEVVDLLNELNNKCEFLEIENKSLRIKLDTHKHPLWSTREAERILNEKNEQIIELTDLLSDEVKKNSDLLSKNNNLRKKLMICEKSKKW